MGVNAKGVSALNLRDYQEVALSTLFKYWSDWESKQIGRAHV